MVPLELARGYRDAKEEEREVTLLRYVECSRCAGGGCKGCASIGWSVESFTARVRVPHGAAPGTRVVVPDASHVVGGAARELTVEIVQPGPRAEQLAAEAADYETKLVTAWQMDEALHRRTMKKLRVGVAVIASFAALAAGVHWAAKSPAGERCASDVECRSGACLRLRTRTLGAEAIHADGQLCTASCTSDLDCPHDMHCTVARRSSEDVGPYVQNAPDSRACIPDGY